MFVKLILIVTFIYLSKCDTTDPKKAVKRGLDDNFYKPHYGNAYDVNHHVIHSAKQAAQDVYLAQQYVFVAKEDLIVAQKALKEKEALALIAAQKSESAHIALKKEVQNVALASQKFANAKSQLSNLQHLEALISANHPHGDLHKPKSPFGSWAPAHAYAFKPVVPLSF